MTPKYGKFRRLFLERAVLRHLGAPNRAVVAGPGVGLDNAVLRVGPGKVLVVTADPVSIIPSLGMETSAWLSVHLIASDYATSANRPEFAAFDFNIPREVGEEELEEYLKSIDAECANLGIAIVAGNTGRYPGAALTVVGGGVMFGTADESRYLLSSMAGTGDDVVMTKGAAIETTGALATMFRNHVEKAIGARLSSKAREYIKLCSVVDDALLAAGIGVRGDGVSAMHDATEGGVLGGLAEMAYASGKDVTVNTEEIFVSDETAALCSAFGMDPLVSLSEGTLLVACKRERTQELVRRLRKNGKTPVVIGRIGRKGGRLFLAPPGRKPKRFSPGADPYWRAYAQAVERGLD